MTDIDLILANALGSYGALLQDFGCDRRFNNIVDLNFLNEQQSTFVKDKYNLVECSTKEDLLDQTSLIKGPNLFLINVPKDDLQHVMELFSLVINSPIRTHNLLLKSDTVLTEDYIEYVKKASRKISRHFSTRCEAPNILSVSANVENPCFLN